MIRKYHNHKLLSEIKFGHKIPHPLNLMVLALISKYVQFDRCTSSQALINAQKCQLSRHRLLKVGAEYIVYCPRSFHNYVTNSFSEYNHTI